MKATKTKQTAVQDDDVMPGDNEGDTIEYGGIWHMGVPRNLVLDTKLSGMARWVWIVLASYHAQNEVTVFPSVPVIAELADMHQDTLRKYLFELAQAGYLEQHQERTDGRFQSASYTLYAAPEVAVI